MAEIDRYILTASPSLEPYWKIRSSTNYLRQVALNCVRYVSKFQHFYNLSAHICNIEVCPTLALATPAIAVLPTVLVNLFSSPNPSSV